MYLITVCVHFLVYYRRSLLLTLAAGISVTHYLIWENQVHGELTVQLY